MSEVRIGCSGWLYKHWRGDFYPSGLKQKDELAFYTQRFDTAEINASFYRMPGETAAAGWRERTPEGFVFAWKAWRYITHLKRLKDPEEPVGFMFSRTEGLGPKLGPILYQLPPGMQLNHERLAAFLAVLPQGPRHAFEFRHPSWYEPAVFELLREHDASLVLSDHHHAPAPWETTASWVYLRGHGPGGRYWGDYPQAALQDWAARIANWKSEGRDVFCYFDNDIGGAAPRDALRLKALLAGSSELAPSE
ncbi:MAG: DUF72 domain-containing protein [Proteobacteria bacterium]|nr:DUF72 domain-containing protein [Pseudomonadota bacterium]MBW3616424.1 DUF72 domain-containing protein [Pseudomonadota bacterium]